MSEAKIEAARELISEKRYAEARALLHDVDHPEARVMLAVLDARKHDREELGRFTSVEANFDAVLPTEVKLHIARELIAEKRYDEARALLRGETIQKLVRCWPTWRLLRRASRLRRLTLLRVNIPRSRKLEA
jgi:hypothetical protein